MTLSDMGIAEPAPPSDAVVPPRSRWRRVGIAPLLALLVPTLLGALLVGLHVHEFTAISVFDEMPHFAYAYDVAHGSIPHRGEAISEGALAQIACRPWQSGFVPPCTDINADPHTVPNALDVQYYPEAGQIYTTDHPPLYYAVSGIGGRLIASVTGISDFVAMRLMGIFWVALGNVFLWLTMRRLRVPPLAIFGVLMVLVSVPLTVYTAATVNPDVASVPVAAMMLYGIIRWWQGAMHPAWFALIGALVVATKITNGVVIMSGLVIIALLSYAGYRDGRARMVRDWLWASIALGGAGAVVLVGWTFRYHHTAVPYSLANIAPNTPTLPDRTVPGFDVRWLFQPDLTMVVRSDKLNPGVMPVADLHQQLLSTLTVVIAVVLLVAVVAVLLQRQAIPAPQLAIASVVAPLVASAVWALYNYYVLHAFVIPVPRYFYEAMVPQLVVLGLALRTRRWQLLVAALGLLTWFAYVLQLRGG